MAIIPCCHEPANPLVGHQPQSGVLNGRNVFILAAGIGALALATYLIKARQGSATVSIRKEFTATADSEFLRGLASGCRESFFDADRLRAILINSKLIDDPQIIAAIKALPNEQVIPLVEMIDRTVCHESKILSIDAIEAVGSWTCKNWTAVDWRDFLDRAVASPTHPFHSQAIFLKGMEKTSNVAYFDNLQADFEAFCRARGVMGEVWRLEQEIDFMDYWLSSVKSQSFHWGWGTPDEVWAQHLESLLKERKRLIEARPYSLGYVTAAAPEARPIFDHITAYFDGI